MPDLISIVSTLYNYAPFVGDLIKSVLEQTYENWELIIVDDGSTDNPMAVIKPYLTDSRIRYIRLPSNRGYSVAKNEGIIASQGEFLVMIDADDMLTPESLQVRYDALKNSDRLYVHATGFELKKGVQHKEKFMEKRRKKFYAAHDINKEYNHGVIHAQSVMLRKELHRLIGLYDEELRVSSDKEMWKRAIALGYFPFFIMENVFVYRIHYMQMSRSPLKLKNNTKWQALLEKNLARRIAEGINSTNTRLLIEDE